MKTLPMYFPDNFDLSKTRTCAQMVEYAYDMYSQWEDAGRPRKESGFHWTPPEGTGLTFSSPIWSTLIKWWFINESEPFGFVARATNGDGYLVFRGTQSVSDWIHDIEARQTSYDFVSGYGKVHNGFFEIYKSLRDDCLKAFGEVGGAIKNLHVTGHSLGSGLSTLAVPDVITQQSFESVCHYNFASPRVGDPEFTARYNENGVLTFRIVNTSDLVPQVPLGSDFLGLLIFTHVGTPVDFTAQYGSIAGNHSMTNAYQYAIEHPDDPASDVA